MRIIRSCTSRAGRSGPLRPARDVFRSLFFVLILGALCGVEVSARSTSETDSLLGSWIDVLPGELPEPVQKTLQRIPDFSRRFLALASYIRRAGEIPNGWSWTSEEVAAFRNTDEFSRMVEEVEHVRSIFAERNPGYSLRVNIEARPLGTQIRKWNGVSSVSRAANDFLDSAERFVNGMLAIDTLGGPHIPADERIDSFRVFLQSYEPPDGREPTVAVPGLSKHGQLRAFDFKVYRGGRMIAGARSATIRTAWDEPGWTRRLFEAATAASPRFVGPLPAPYEPWHYNYDPERNEDSEPLVFPETEGGSHQSD